jgi:hypothetical protein
VATPWQLRRASDNIRARVGAKSWAFLDDKLAPFEFRFSDAEDPYDTVTSIQTQFVEELGAFLREHSLNKRFGISLFPNNPSTGPVRTMHETTLGRVSFQIPSTGLKEDVVKVAWQFDSEGGRAVAYCRGCKCIIHG